MARLASPEDQDQLDRLETTAQLAQRVRPDLLVRWARPVTSELLAFPAQLGPLAWMDRREQLAPRASTGLWDQWDLLVQMDPVVRLGRLVNPEPREPLVSRDRRDPKDNLVSWASLVHRELLVRADPPVLLALQDLLAAQGRWGLSEALGPMVRLV